MVITAPWSTPKVSQARAGQFPAMTGGTIAALRRLVASPSAWFPEDHDRAVAVDRPHAGAPDGDRAAGATNGAAPGAPR